MSKNKKTSQPKALHQSHHLIENLSRAEILLDQHKPTEACQVLEELERRYSNHSDVLSLLVNASYDMKDYSAYEWAVYRLSRLNRSPEIFISLAGAYIQTYRPGLALRCFEEVLRRWPAHPRSDEIRQTIEQLRPTLLAAIDQPHLSQAEIFELAVGHDEVRFLMEHGQLSQCKQAAEKLLKSYPRFLPAMNNLTQVHLLESNHSEARHLAQSVLNIDPENIHALSNLARLLYLSADFSGAREMALRMKASSSQVVERWAKQAEVYSLLADDDSLLALFAQAQQDINGIGASRESALLLHHTAVALAQSGEKQQASSLWKKAMKFVPSFELARKNLEDLDQPVEKRNGPWAFEFSFWVPTQLTQEMVKILSEPVKPKSSAGTENAMRKFLQHHPALVALMPHMLARGDVKTREFVIRIIKMAETPELIALLKDFILGDRGTDAIRLDAVQFLSNNDYLPTAPTRMWIAGKWTDILNLNFEVTRQAQPEFRSPAVEKLAVLAIAALHAENPKHAQSLFEQALKKEETPSLLNNLAAALEMQGQSNPIQSGARHCSKYSHAFSKLFFWHHQRRAPGNPARRFGTSPAYVGRSGPPQAHAYHRI